MAPGAAFRDNWSNIVATFDECMSDDSYDAQTRDQATKKYKEKVEFLREVLASSEFYYKRSGCPPFSWDQDQIAETEWVQQRSKILGWHIAKKNSGNITTLKQGLKHLLLAGKSRQRLQQIAHLLTGLQASPNPEIMQLAMELPVGT